MDFVSHLCLCYLELPKSFTKGALTVSLSTLTDDALRGVKLRARKTDSLLEQRKVEYSVNSSANLDRHYENEKMVE